jgi:aldehyde dehydrogenase (NAD+)
LCILGYDNEDQAVEMANDTEYGLAAYVSGDDLTHARALGARLSAGQVRINFCQESAAAFGGIRRSGNGREMGPEGLKEYLELKVVIG